MVGGEPARSGLALGGDQRPVPRARATTSPIAGGQARSSTGPKTPAGDRLVPAGDPGPLAEDARASGRRTSSLGAGHGVHVAGARLAGERAGRRRRGRGRRPGRAGSVGGDVEHAVVGGDQQGGVGGQARR